MINFKLLTYVRHKEQGIEGLVINPSNDKSSYVTIYDPNCPNDDDFIEDSYGIGSLLEFKDYELEEIQNPSEELIENCKNVIKNLREGIEND
tara:strand:- start:61 stop:336 length:276 start_codon:yes stop_codon:yes gene_type:complete